MVSCHLRRSIVKDNRNWLLILKLLPGGISWFFGPTGGLTDVREEKIRPFCFKLEIILY
jgi:hypothetical protein